MMDTEYVTDKILEAILTDQKILLLPRLMYINMFLKRYLRMMILEFIKKKE
jgi:hypothetical protein